MKDGFWWIDLRYDGVATITHTIERTKYQATFKDAREAVDTMIANNVLPHNMKDVPDQLRRGGILTLALHHSLTATDFARAGFIRVEATSPLLGR